ncbi:similar to Saccharomyces cerevisiae YHR193C EGD2 Alpha subunit of the heteromeric nascent polypeptide-associated complex (NAC) involved in protein sorting and translocation [Maudiozyma barnettii]|uniref:Nascent polypeptide-associated complex subunit alpha n=1 Tax=Maudiozyma barnettii TaxID=61262 RepID=A0A8H2VF24_9SACH|nr:Egd2p [Kazachstania barnettii]CAB4254419.1 similar to Saccharomyces cerevisiae YHR193C EGD2 Alpha subunit of the heteromeric nascent polypeptide-associated complex (NAC) involved in protein sorting and translocation [Kazachstania barnettii]CAD1782349.1 similar to Saccharomyces cerevisiae YHR193C EGD2 Alpha subunit of the heteromeric nascent polypeptide-associated complex (NAC) involved in protein sorting and translocation [Kazachstania barnettii]
MSAPNVSILSKNEKKSKDLLLKLGLKRVPGIIRVAYRKKNNEIIAIEKPEVYRTAGGNYVVFGEPKVDDFTQKLAAAQEQAQASGIMPTDADVATKTPADIQADMQAAADAIESGAGKIEEADDVEVDAGDLSNEDIELVMQQANVAKNAAIKALKSHNGDIVNAIMSLSK